MSLLLYVAAVPMAHFHPYLALGLITLVTVIWIIPTAGTWHAGTDSPH